MSVCLVRRLKSIVKAISNIYQTPNGYRLDYLLTLISPLKTNVNPLPWMNYKAINFIISKLLQINTVFEYGSGQSTRFWLSKGKSVISIEHDPLFYQELSNHLVGKDNIDYRLLEQEIDNTANQYDPESPHYYHSNDSKGYMFKRYVNSISVYGDESFDVVVVDGRARPACIFHATRKIKCGGFLILDNSDREYYLKNTSDCVAGWERHDFVGTVRGLLHHEQTSIFIKPQPNRVIS